MAEHPSLMHTALRWLAGGLVVAALVAFSVLQQTRLGRELNHLPEGERRALYQRTLETLRSTCANTSGSTLKDYCREQAEFISAFPDCVDACRSLVLQLTMTATR
jgi:hypothetical protein